MANELTVTASLSGFKASVMSSAVGRALSSYTRNMGGTAWIENLISVAITETLVPVGQVTQLGLGYFLNLDPTNAVKLYAGTGLDASALVCLNPGDVAIVPMNPAVTLYAIALIAPCLLEYLIFSR